MSNVITYREFIYRRMLKQAVGSMTPAEYGWFLAETKRRES